MIKAILLSAVLTANEPCHINWPLKQDAVINYSRSQSSSNRRERRSGKAKPCYIY